MGLFNGIYAGFRKGEVMKYIIKLLSILSMVIFFSSCHEKRRCLDVVILCDEEMSKEECYKTYEEERKKCERGEF